jgi:hypothetical protein
MSVQPHEAMDALQECESIRVRTRATLCDFWFPLVVFGALMLAGAPVILALGASALGPYWVLASLLGAIAVMRYYRRQKQRVGLEGPYLPYGLTGIGIFVGSLLALCLAIFYGNAGRF